MSVQRIPGAGPAGWRMAARRAIGTALWTSILFGCGGGVFINLGGSSNTPTVSLVANVTSASPGDTVRLVAAAVADRSIDQVAFFRLEANGSATLLGSDASSPYEWGAVVPAGARAQVRFFARAFDNIGQSGDSDPVTITLP